RDRRDIYRGGFRHAHEASALRPYHIPRHLFREATAAAARGASNPVLYPRLPRSNPGASSCSHPTRLLTPVRYRKRAISQVDGVVASSMRAPMMHAECSTLAARPLVQPGVFSPAEPPIA